MVKSNILLLEALLAHGFYQTRTDMKSSLPQGLANDNLQELK
jgi:hypothetical protein